MTLQEIAKYRLINQQIAGTKLKTAVEMVAWFGAVQAQEYSLTKWGLGLRLPLLKDNDVEKDFTDGKILRTHLLRPTWHFVTSDDIRWVLMLTASRVNAANKYMYRQVGLDSSILNRSINILVKSLQGGKQFTRDAINNEFQKNKITASGHRLSYIMMNAELTGIICSGARQGNQFTYTLLEERICAINSFNKDEALAELTKRYFFNRGPATIKDFSTWSGLTLTECRRGKDMTRSYLNMEVIEREEYYFPIHISPNKIFPQTICLLPVYDEFIMGYKDRSAIFEFKNRLKLSSSFHYSCMIVSDGQIIGTWKRTITNKSIQLECEFFRPLNKIQRKEFDSTVLRLEEFSNLPVNYAKI